MAGWGLFDSEKEKWMATKMYGKNWKWQGPCGRAVQYIQPICLKWSKIHAARYKLF